MLTETAPTYPGTETIIEEDDYIVALGLGEGNDYGRVLGCEDGTVSVHWLGSETGVDHAIEQLAGVEVFLRLEDARETYLAGR